MAIPFQLRGNVFQIELDPKPDQPGNGEITSIGKHKNIHAVLKTQPDDQKAAVPARLVDARKAKPYHPAIPNPVIDGLNLEMLNILFSMGRV